MERLSTSTRWLATVSLMLTLTAVVGAHDFWIEPSTFRANVGDPVRIHLRVGERFAGDPVARDESGIERFVLAGPGPDRPVIGRQGMDPAGLLRLDAAGLWYVGYTSKGTPLELAPEAFEKYLREEGLERIIKDRETRKEAQLPGREQFSRSVKALLRAGPADGAQGYEKVLGLPLEFALEADPQGLSGRLPLRLLRDGRPLSGTLVVAYRKAAGSRVQGAEAFRGRTDAKGRVTLSMAAGQWLVKAVDMQRADPASGADWHSVWTAVTFDVVPTRPSLPAAPPYSARSILKS